MADRQVHLICNAHLDPVWLWEWEEGAAEALATFRVAAELCEQNDTFVFNHNEAILYQWVQAYEPELFDRIRRLVRRGRWHIMGGWFLQPDCNLPSGEALVRQILAGRRYFREHFEVEPTTAINFDPFGHSRGLVQLLAKSGYDSYLFGRPRAEDLELPADSFTWVGFDGSRVRAHRFEFPYNSPLGKARQKVEQWLARHPDVQVGAVLWGVGNHGGGPSRQDLRALNALMQRRPGPLRHSTPEAYFAALTANGAPLPEHADDLNPWATGCYTSQHRIKQAYRQLENSLFQAEKMATAAAVNGLLDYPRAELRDAQRDLLIAGFHDILPGSSIEPVEAAALRTLGHGLEIAGRVRAQAFFALTRGQRRARPGRVPILVFNPHPYPVSTLVECEFNLPDCNFSGTFTQVRVHQGPNEVPTQVEKEYSNNPIDWRKRVVFDAVLRPGAMNRFDAVLEELPRRPPPQTKPANGVIRVRGKGLDVIINTRTGLVDRYRVGRREQVQPGAFRPVVMADNGDPWGMIHQYYNREIGRFRLLDRHRSATFAGTGTPTLAPVRVIEDGPVRVVVEALFGLDDSAICQRYKIPRVGSELEVETRVYWNHRDAMLKLLVPLAGRPDRFLGQVAYGVQPLPTDGRECVAQKWVAVVNSRGDRALSCINDGVYGCDCSDAGLRLTLLRGAAYACHPIGDVVPVPTDRFVPRMDQGLHCFRFWLNAGPRPQRLERIDREALVKAETPMSLSCSPAGHGKAPRPLAVLRDDVIQMTVAKLAEADDHIILRLFEPTGMPRRTVLALPGLGRQFSLALDPFEVCTLKVDRRRGTLRRVNLLEDETAP